MPDSKLGQAKIAPRQRHSEAGANGRGILRDPHVPGSILPADVKVLDDPEEVVEHLDKGPSGPIRSTFRTGMTYSSWR